MKKCPYCFSDLDDRATICSGCRKRVGKVGNEGIAKKPIGLLGVCLILFFFLFIFIFAIIIFGNYKRFGTKLQSFSVNSGNKSWFR